MDAVFELRGKSEPATSSLWIDDVNIHRSSVDIRTHQNERTNKMLKTGGREPIPSVHSETAVIQYEAYSTSHAVRFVQYESYSTRHLCIETIKSKAGSHLLYLEAIPLSHIKINTVAVQQR